MGWRYRLREGIAVAPLRMAFGEPNGKIAYLRRFGLLEKVHVEVPLCGPSRSMG
jgi:hypothetical protein